MSALAAASGTIAPEIFTKDEVVALSDALLAEPDLAIIRSEDISRIEAAGLAWDIGAIRYEPADAARAAIGPDGRRIGFFLLHSGEDDYHLHEELALLMARKRGFTVVNMTFPGRFYFDDPQHHWPGETFHADGSVRTPIWLRGETIAPDEYDIIPNDEYRDRYGVRSFARARPGTRFYDRMAAWPLAFEVAMLDLCRRHFPPASYSIYAHGHSTGGPFTHALLQRVENAVGICGIENSPFGCIWGEVNGRPWLGQFNDLMVRTWREIARYRGAEALKKRGAEALMSLPSLMEEVFEDWETAKLAPQFKAESILHVNCVPALTAAAEATAKRLELSSAATAELVARYLSYPLPLTGPGVKPVPPLIFIYCAYSRDHTRENYLGKIVPGLLRIDPPPKIRLVEFGAGTHFYQKPEAGLPKGCSPAALSLWHQAIVAGYFLPGGR